MGTVNIDAIVARFHELGKYMLGYETTQHYLIRINLYKCLTENGDLGRAMSNSEKHANSIGVTGRFEGILGSA